VRGAEPQGQPEGLPEATVARLHRYRRILGELAGEGVRTIASDGLAQAAGVNPAQVRKDLSLVGSRGTRGVGYETDALREHLTKRLGLTRDWRVLIAGVGNLGRALASYRGFHEPGFTGVALLDVDPGRIGTTVAGVVVEPIADAARVVAREGVDIAIIAVPAEAAQEVAGVLAGAGVTAILNFAPTHVAAGPEVRVRRVDLSTELGVLAYYDERGRRLDSPAEARHASPGPGRDLPS
jgi:redox-sensing transcriptional repressor